MVTRAEMDLASFCRYSKRQSIKRPALLVEIASDEPTGVIFKQEIDIDGSLAGDGLVSNWREQCAMRATGYSRNPWLL